jgi:hypothetical protein
MLMELLNKAATVAMRKLTRRQRIRLLTRLNRVTEANPIEAFSELGSPAHSELIGILHQLASRPVVPARA